MGERYRSPSVAARLAVGQLYRAGLLTELRAGVKEPTKRDFWSTRRPLSEAPVYGLSPKASEAVGGVAEALDLLAKRAETRLSREAAWDSRSGSLRARAEKVRQAWRVASDKWYRLPKQEPMPHKVPWLNEAEQLLDDMASIRHQHDSVQRDLDALYAEIFGPRAARDPDRLWY